MTNQITKLHYQQLKISGNKATDFLQGQLTCDLKEFKYGDASMGCYCDRKGKVQASFMLYLHGEDYYIVLHESIAEETMALLNKYGVFSKINIEIMDVNIYGLYSEISNMPEKNSFSKLDSCTILAYPIDNTYLIIGKPTEDFIKESNLVTDNNFWIELHIKNGLVQIEAATSNLFTPAMLNYDKWGAVSISKGCYLGQEIIMRSAKLGNVKRCLCYFRGDGKFVVGGKLNDNKGVVVIALDGCGLVVLAKSEAEIGIDGFDIFKV